MVKWDLASVYVLWPCCGPLSRISEIVGAEVRRSRGAQEQIWRSGDAVIVNIPAKEYMRSTTSIYMRKRMEISKVVCTTDS